MPTCPGARQRICWWEFLVMGLSLWGRGQNPIHLLFPSGNLFSFPLNWKPFSEVFTCYPLMSVRSHPGQREVLVKKILPVKCSKQCCYNCSFFSYSVLSKSKSLLSLFFFFSFFLQSRGKDKALPCAAGRSDCGAGHLRVWQFSGSHQLLWEGPPVPQNETTLSHQWGHTGEDRHCCEYHTY